MRAQQSEALDIKFKGMSKISVIKRNYILMQYFKIKINATIVHDEQYINFLNIDWFGPCTGLIHFSLIPALLDPMFYLSSNPSYC